MIRTIINDDTKFLKIIRGLNSHFYHKVVTTKQIEDYISSQSGTNFGKLFDQYLRAAEVPILEYKIRNDEFEYRFTNCNYNFTMPIKTNLTKDDWVSPTTSWQSFKFKNKNSLDTLKIDPDFYMTVKKVE